jgi:PQQ-like domain
MRLTMHRLGTLAVLLSIAPFAAAQHRVLVQGNGKLAIVDAKGEIEWDMPWGGIHDLHVLANGNIMVQQGAAKVVEIDAKAKKVVWSYDSAAMNGNKGKRVEVHAFQPLEDGKIMIAESGIGRIIEIDRDGKIEREIKLKVKQPSPHRDTRLVRKLANGNYLVCHEGDGAVREYDAKGTVVWEIDVPLFDQKPRDGHGPEAWGNQTFAAVRLKNGNTLISTGNGHSVIEVTPQSKIVWQIHQKDLPNIVLAWVTTIEVLPNGNYLIGNCHAGKGQPLLVEIEPKTKRVVWTFDQFDRWGNSVSNTKILDQAPAEPAKPTSHSTRKIEGWTVKIDDRLLQTPNEEVGKKALRFLENKLFDITVVVPKDRVRKLQKVTIVLDLSHGKLTSMQYHPSAGWLKANGYSPDLAKCVHLPRAADLPTKRNINEQPWVILHELAHAYHDQVLGFDNVRIREAYDNYKKSGHGDKTLLYNGKRVRHYALTNPKEFFAEMTEAYFGVNDFYPFTRAELRESEPEIYSLLREIWEGERKD